MSCLDELCIEKAYNLGVWTLKKNSGAGKNGHCVLYRILKLGCKLHS